MADNKGKGKGPRLYHKKSRNGCQRCRARKVKCDEVRPICGGCLKHGVSCGYARSKSTNTTDSSVSLSEPRRDASLPNETDYAAASPTYESSPLEPPTNLSNNNLTDSTRDFPESTSRRLLELRLLHHYTSLLCSTFPASHDPKVLVAWRDAVPQLALKHPPLLYGLLSLTALHLSKTDSSLQAAHRKYLDLTLYHHRQAIATLNDNNLDATCLTSIFILYNSFAALQDRVLEASYEPPVQLFHMSQGTYDIFRIAADCLKRDEMTGSITHELIMSVPLDMKASFSEKGRAHRFLLDDSHPHCCVDGIAASFGRRGIEDAANSELADPETRAAYEESLTYIEHIGRAVESNQDVLQICRWIVTFPVRVPRRMIQLIKEKRPRALVVLARYFKVVERKSHIWWIGDTPKREIEAIKTGLPDEWRELIET